MGADLYIWHDELDDYERSFRDSYNSSSVLAAHGLSWWADVSPKLDDGYLWPDGVSWLRGRIESWQLPFTAPPEPKGEQIVGAALRAAGVELISNDVDLKYLHGARNRLLRFLGHSIRLDVPIDCSL